MLLAGLFAGFLFLGMIVADWVQFTRLNVGAGRYGCGVARGEDRLPLAPWTRLIERFDRNGVLALPHGVARFFQEERRILLRPCAARFRTLWPMNGSIDILVEGTATRLSWVKRVPWSSAVLTVIWFAVVVLGTLSFAITFIADGGLSTLSGLLMAGGITGIGLLVLVFGLVTVSLAYRLEDHRLTLAYQELRAALAPDSTGMGEG
jgi:hypothetical protein